MGDSSTTVKELKDKVQKFCEERNWDQFHNPKDLAIGISTEASELLDLFRFKREEDIKEIMLDPDKRQKVGDELADVAYLLCHIEYTHMVLQIKKEWYKNLI